MSLSNCNLSTKRKKKNRKQTMPQLINKWKTCTKSSRYLTRRIKFSNKQTSSFNLAWRKPLGRAFNTKRFTRIKFLLRREISGIFICRIESRVLIGPSREKLAVKRTLAKLFFEQIQRTIFYPRRLAKQSEWKNRIKCALSVCVRVCVHIISTISLIPTARNIRRH